MASPEPDERGGRAPQAAAPTRHPAQSAHERTIVAAPLVDAHIHPDKTSWGGCWMHREPRTGLRQVLAADLAAQTGYDRSVEERSYALLAHAAANGTAAMRAHVDVASEYGLRNVHGVRAAADRLAGVLDVQIVAFPQQGLLINPGTADLLRAALHEGADVVGGMDPLSLDGDVAGHLDVVFGLAIEHGREIDIHLHDRDERGLEQIREIARRTIAEGLHRRVVVSHAFALCDPSLEGYDETVALAGEAGIWITTVAPGTANIPPVERLARDGIGVAVGSDGVRDAWSPFGTGSMLDRAHLLAYRRGATSDLGLEDCYRLAAEGGAAIVGRSAREVREPGIHAPAPVAADAQDRLEFSGECLAQVVVDAPPVARVVRGGRVVAEGGALV